MEKALISDIKRFAVHDGDGIRTTVFFKGCPLKCVWCHNPECLSFSPEIAYFKSKCIGCGECVEVCPVGAHGIDGEGHHFDRSRCIGCGKCADACLGSAITHYGKYMTVEELMPLLLEDRAFYENGGGVTLSGGECLSQADFCAELLKALKAEGINTAVDTCGYLPRESIDKVIDYTDTFLYDLKAFSPETHKKCTGKENQRIIENIKYIDSRGKAIEIRVPFVPDLNSDEMKKIAELVKGLSNVKRVKVLAYHKYAASKYEALGLENTLPENLPSDEQVSKAEKLFSGETVDDLIKKAQDIDTKYRPVPFWSLNAKLEVNETERQVKLMKEAGLGGFFMHARGGLSTEYMSEEWFDNIEAATSTAEKLGMQSWAYDENGWPSGFGNGAVNGLGEDYIQKYLRIEKGEKNTPRTIANFNGWHIYYDVNPYYVDLMDKKVAEEFIKAVYEKYYERFGNRITGFFTDEPQLSRNGIPWSNLLPEKYLAAYGEELIPHLPELFFAVGDYKKTRMRFWRLVTKLFSEGFAKTVYDWCEQRGLKLTGHMVLEESLSSQLTSNGAIMPSLEYFHIPGMDWLGRYPFPCLTALEVSSVAHQLGREQVLSESFAGSGHESGFDDFKRLIDWQMVRGITRLCPHLEGYSLQGIRKRDYPPAMYYQQPWWNEYPKLIDDLSRTGMLLGAGKAEFDTLLIHPQTTAWIYFDGGESKGLAEYEREFQNIVNSLEGKHICFDLGDETILERHACVEDGMLVVGKQRYRRVILPPHEMLFESTENLLREFIAAGGEVTTEGDVAPNEIIDNPNITFTERCFDWGKLYFFVNSTNDVQKATVKSGSTLLHSADGSTEAFCGYYEFRPGESILVLDDGAPQAARVTSTPRPSLNLGGKWKVKQSSENLLTLDRCDCYFDGKLIEQDCYILDIQERACEVGRSVKVRMDFFVDIEQLPDEIYLLCERPEICEIAVNGKELHRTDEGWFVDPAFRKISLENTLKTGENLISITVDFYQSEKVLKTMQSARYFEGEKNKLTYDVEIEPIYLVGNFGVFCKSSPRNETEYGTAVYDRPFVISAMPEYITLDNMGEQGLLFFAGKLTVEKEISSKTAPTLRFDKCNINALGVKVNGIEQGCLMWEPLELELNGWREGTPNTVELTVTNNLRNMLGPHHVKKGAGAWAGIDCFMKAPGLFGCREWDGGYELMRFSIISR